MNVRINVYIAVCQARPMDFGLRCPSEVARFLSRGVNVNVIYLYDLKPYKASLGRTLFYSVITEYFGL